MSLLGDIKSIEVPVEDLLVTNGWARLVTIHLPEGPVVHYTKTINIKGINRAFLYLNCWCNQFELEVNFRTVKNINGRRVSSIRTTPIRSLSEVHEFVKVVHEMASTCFPEPFQYEGSVIAEWK